jgi:glycosyltransferase involved in cell wall biosynthesis
MPLTVLAVHNQYLIRGGEDETHLAEVRLLRDRGHKVIEYVEDNKRVASLGNVQTSLRSIWSKESYDIVRQHIRDARPDVMQVQNSFPLISPSVYYAAQAEHVPIIQTLQNFRLFCLNAVYYRDGHVCEDCRGGAGYLPGIAHKCYRNSWQGSTSVALMLSMHWAVHTWQRRVNAFIAVTEFGKRKFIEGGLPADKIFVKPNFLNSDPGIGTGEGGYALFVGRLSAEKGIATLLKAWSDQYLQTRLVIAGDGPLIDDVMRASQTFPAIEYIGRQTPDQILTLMRNARFLILPSECYEGLPRVIVEAYACGTPVIASKLGSMEYLIEHGRTGLHFNAGDSGDLRDKVLQLLSQPDMLQQMRQNARSEFEAHYTAERNYDVTLQIYEKVIREQV